MPSETTSYFGLERLNSDEKTARVAEVFDHVAPKYDLMNDVMSLGLHRWWKAQFIKALPLAPGFVCADISAGSGDIGLGLIKRGVRHLTMIDPNPAMLQQAQRKCLNAGHVQGVEFMEAPAEALPLADASVDLYTISFGLRNVTDRLQALSEAWRVLKPGGWFYCLEFSHPTIPGFDGLYAAYSKHIIPKMGEIIAHNRGAYTYLVDSIRTFPTQKDLQRELEALNFLAVGYKNFTGGVVAMHYGKKTDSPQKKA